MWDSLNMSRSESRPSRSQLQLLPLLLLSLNICWQQCSVTADSADKSKAYIADYFPALNEFSTHTVIRPQVQHAHTQQDLQSTLDAADGLHTPHISLSYSHEGKRVQVDLQRNDRLLPDSHFLRYQNSSRGAAGGAAAPGSHVVRNFTKTEVDLCHYQGHIRGQPDSTVALSTCGGGLNGIVFDGQQTYFIHPHVDGSGRLQDEHYLLRHADMHPQNATCGYDSHKDNHSKDDKEKASLPPHRLAGDEFQRMLLRKRRQADDSRQLIRGPYNANKYSSYVELVIVVDNKVYKHFGESTKKVHEHCKNLANIVNALYVPLNIFVALVGVVIWNESNEIEFSSDGDVTLRNFLNYRSTKLVLEHPNDNAQLLTKETFAGGVVGKALKGPICTYEYSGGVSMQHSPVTAMVATTMAHEMGHNFGMEHDSPDCHCPDEKCVMAASSTSVVPVSWSSCSIDQLTIAFSRGMNYCLRNKPERLFDSPTCGNGFVEPGEQCDCGLPEHCRNSCCNATTCMLHTNASCATGECCDLDKCRPKLAGSACREAENECDLPEYCTGESEYCPTDVYRRDTEPCDGGQAYCFHGNCRSHANQCRILWGPTGDNSVHCYHKNMEGSRLGNCGYNRLNKTFVQCEARHVNCGMLHCNHLNERLEFGMESAAVLSHSYVSHDRKIVACRTALVDLGLQTTDPGLAPNGAKCGEDMMCVDQRCLPVEQVRQRGMGTPCPDDCSGNGICNSRGHCHCDVGFGGESCAKAGSGGSQDSGPATDPNGALSLKRFLCVLFFMVLPTVGAFWLFYHCYKNGKFSGGKLADNILKTSGAGPSKPNASRNNQNGSGPPPGNGLPKSTPSSTDDMNSALLKSPSDSNDPSAGAGMFGKFQGFTLRPLNATSPASNYSGPNVAFVQPTVQQDNGVPQRMAPPPPAAKGETVPATSPESGKSGATWPRAAPALPPPNPGSTARPIISKPVLDSSTRTLVPLKGSTEDLSPQRQAPAPPVPLHVDPKLNVKRDGTIRRFASFLKKEDKKEPPKEKTYIDRERLRTLEISAPMPVPAAPQTESSNSDSETTPREEETKNLVKRAQSMRSPTKKGVPLQSFGSMRSPPGLPRPKSQANSAGGGASSRPKSPPPRPPPVVKKTNSVSSSGYQRPVMASNQLTPENTYDDCECVETRASTDDIYSVIDEIPPAAQTLKRSDLVASLASNGSADMGLLGEIVNEFEKLNGDSIYSGKPAATATTAEPTTVEAPRSPQRPAPPKPASSVIAMAEDKSVAAAAPTYLRSTAVNAPVARVAPTLSDISPSRAFSSFKPAQANSSKATPAPVVVLPKRTGSSIGQSTRPKSFMKSTAKTLPNGTTAAPSATIQKPKPLSAKPSFSGALGKRGPGGAASTIAPTPPTVKAAAGAGSATPKSNIASLTQRFEASK
ncbi:disintegrin and metalloproteinase domain-containing protein 12 [Drosophila guanche]|uniref:Blast:Disintegrin and metalloproteinase domain-containing protein 12 n=1 Tax=Drosophila guanche TaxID=7266 RepID=A0A3B0JE49_DROGU|nr:disintegrin and metalloproteinase domain-containing protein 12 [Drosophila guanche]SPP80365.1 blast:Disintegrin and metalloproteinase domain-containing protein 12 [Drosophila guanche]